MTKFGRFTWGKDTHPEADKTVNPAEVLHEPAYIVMKMGSGELTAKDQEYIAQNLDSMLSDENLQEMWSHVHIGMAVMQYKTTLRAVASEWKRTHPNFNAKPYYIEGKKFVVVPTQSGTEVYEVLKVKNKGKPNETVDLTDQKPWVVAPAGSTKLDVLQLLGNQRREDKMLDDNRKIREILGGRK